MPIFVKFANFLFYALLFSEKYPFLLGNDPKNLNLCHKNICFSLSNTATSPTAQARSLRLFRSNP